MATSKKAIKRRRLVKGSERIGQTMTAVQRADLMAVATHDLRNPLGVVLVTAAMLARELTAPNQLDQVAAIRRAALEMTHIIEDLTDGASIDAGTLEVDPEACDPAEVIEEAATQAKAALGDRAISISVQTERSLPLIHADRLRLQQVLSRIVANALRFIPKSGDLRFEATKQGDFVQFVVADTGPTIPESQCSYAFMRRPPTGRRSSRGTGLGMFVVKGIVEAHGGQAEMASDPDHGNRVSFTMPIVKRA